MFVTRKIPVLLGFLFLALLPVAVHAQALQSEALADNRRQSTLETLDRILYEQYTVLTSDRSTEEIRMDLLVKDQLVIWERIQEAQKYLTFYDVADLMSTLADNYYVLRDRMDDLVFQPMELTQAADELKEKLSEYVDMGETMQPEMIVMQDDIPSVPEPPGLALGVGYAIDAISVADGGVESGAGFAQVANVNLSLDLEKVAGLKGTSMFFQALYHQGNSISELAGDWQGVSNMEGPEAVRLFEAWFDQKMFSGHGSLRMGLYNLNTEFYALSSAGLFVNNGFGIGGEFGRSGQNGPSIPPVTSLALRFALHSPSNEYFMIGVFDGVPGDPDDRTRTIIRLNENDGALITAEGGYKLGGYMSPGSRYLKVGVGYWMYTAPHEEILRTDEMGNPFMSQGNQGAYALVEGTVFKEGGNSHDGLTLYGRMGIANKTYNDIGYSWSAGLVYNGLIPGRSNDSVGLAVTSIYAGSDFQDAASISGLQMQTAESVIEFTYSLSVNNWFTIQPDLQYVINPGLGIQTDQTLAAGARLKVGI